MTDRLSSVEVARILDVSGVRDLGAESTDMEILRALVSTRRLIRHAPLHDIALVYAALVHYFDILHIRLPGTTEGLFFDPLYLDLYDGQIREEERARVRAEDRSVAQDAGRSGREESDGDSAGEHGGRSRRVEIMVPRRGQRVSDGTEAGDSGEVPKEPEPVEGTGRGRPGDDLPF